MAGPARVLAVELFPDQLTVTRSQTFTAYERLSTALTVAQVCGVQRLCNYYSARLTPLPGPDSSRESNHRLAQITQYARQLASSPSIIDNRSRQHLNDVGLTAWDCVIINQIIGFIGFQARTIATFQAYLSDPVRWLPGLEIQNYADASLFADEIQYAGEAAMRWKNYLKSTQKVQQQNFANWPNNSLSHPISLSLLERLLNSTRVNTQPDNKLAALLCARINGSPACFAACMDSSNEYKKISPLLRKGENEINQWADRHSVEHVAFRRYNG